MVKKINLRLTIMQRSVCTFAPKSKNYIDMRHNSIFSKALLLSLLVGGTFMYAQVDPDETQEVSDSTEWDDGISLTETVIIGKGVIDLEENRSTPVAVSTIKKEEIQDKSQGNTEFPDIMKNTPGVYVANQAGGFGDSQMTLRGFDQSNTAFLLNGQPINGMEDGNMYWSNWSGMTDIANAVEVQRGLGSSKLAISSVGGTVNIVTKTTEKQQGGFAQLVFGNDSYMKGTFAYDTGLNNKWAFSVMLSHWQGHRNYARGTAGQGQNYFFSVGFKPNNRHALNFLVTGAPQWHDQNYSKAKSVYDQYGHKYNNNIGYYADGEYKSLRRNFYHKPVMNLNWDWDISNQMSLSTVAYASFGRGGGTGNYGTGVVNNTDDGLINWDATEAYNSTVVGPGEIPGGQVLPGGFTGNNIGYLYYNDFTDADGDGNQQRQRAGYIIRASVNNHAWYGGVSNFKFEVNENFSFNVGADIRFYKGDHFRQVVDFLGLDGYYDNSTVVPRGIVTESFDTNPWSSLFKFADEDQRINYDYSEWINYQGGFGQAEYKTDLFSVFVQGAVSNQSYQREDRYNFAGGYKSDKVSKIGYNIKGGLAFNLNEENTVFGNAGYYSRQPFLDNVFTGKFTNSAELIEPEIDNEEITGFEVGYRFKRRGLSINLNAYHTTWGNRTVAQFTTGEVNGEEVDIQDLARGITQVHKGIEADFNIRITRHWNLRGYGTLADFTYDGTDSSITRVVDSGEIIAEEDGIDNKGVHVSNAPMFTFGLGTEIKLVKGLSVDGDFNYYARNYEWMDFSTVKEDETRQLSPFALMDAGITYEFKFGKQSLRFRGNVKNVFNGAYYSQSDRFGYFLTNGRTYNAGLTFSF